MIPANFDYQRPTSVAEAIQLLGAGEEVKILAGGHSLIPAMKLRLARPQTLVDLGRLAELKYVREDAGLLCVGAMTTHHEIESSDLLRARCPILPEVAAVIGDAQVRNRGTLGGSLVHADPAADWPAAILALDAEMVIQGPNGRRSVPATEFFVEMMQSAVQPNEILVEIRVPITGAAVAYAKFAQKASGFAIAGVAAIINTKQRRVSLGVTGVSTKAFRATVVEDALNGRELTQARIVEAAARADEGVETLNDIHASAGYRAHLIRVNTRRALELAFSRA